MQKNPFGAVPATAESHFRLYIYAAILHVMDRLAQSMESREQVFERFPFLSGYVDELARAGLQGLTTGEAVASWRAGLIGWETAAPGFLPLRALAQTVGLDYAELVLYFCIGLSEEDPRFGALFETLQAAPGQHHMTYGLVNAWWAGAELDARATVQALMAARLISVGDPAAPRVDWALRPVPLIWDVLRGQPPALPAEWVTYRPPDQLLPLDELIITPALSTQLARLPALLAAGEVGTILVRGPLHNGRKTILGSIARALGLGLLELRDLKGPDDERWHLAGPLATLLHAMPAITYALAPGETAVLPRLGAYSGPVSVAAGRHGGVRTEGQALTLVADMPDPVERRAHWLRALAQRDRDEGVPDLDAICRQFRLTGGAIYAVARLAHTYAQLAGLPALTIDNVQEAARALNRQTLDTLAAHLPAFGDWGALAVCGETLAELRTLESRCRHREGLSAQVSPTLGAQMTPGVRALFSGPSGTGKTLAARILANALKMDLYRLDLSSVVNKYIGETEKNLNDLFARAEELDVILLIDEGDALLTQRTGVFSSNDRYANLETNFLLQRLESYTGIVIITTNAAERIDNAFQRRMDVTVEFRAPEAAERWAIWQLHLPADHGVDLGLLRELAARCTLTGGQIRNVVLHASVLALDDSGKLASTHLEAAVQREYRKKGDIPPLRARTHPRRMEA